MVARRELLAASLIITLSLILLQTAEPNSEGDALYSLRQSLSDPDRVLQSWDTTLVNPCTWFHVSCNQHNLVTRLTISCLIQRLGLGFGFIEGTIHFGYCALSDSTFFFGMDLGNSNLSGHLVPELGKLHHLQYLELYKNEIQGTIPSEFGNLKNLISLDLYNNNLTWKIPPSLAKLKSLVFLRLNENRLTGPIPRELTAISSLKVVDVSGNDLCGTIPTEGPFEHIPLQNFENNVRLEGPELVGLASYETNCT